MVAQYFLNHSPHNLGMPPARCPILQPALLQQGAIRCDQKCIALRATGINGQHRLVRA